MTKRKRILRTRMVRAGLLPVFFLIGVMGLYGRNEPVEASMSQAIVHVENSGITDDPSTIRNDAKALYRELSSAGAQFLYDDANGYIFWATRAASASNSQNLKMRSIGYDIVVANGIDPTAKGYQSVSVSIARYTATAANTRSEKGTQSYLYTKSNCFGSGSGADSDGYIYGMYAIKMEDIAALCYAKNPEGAKKLFAQSEKLYVSLYGIMVTKKYTGELSGYISSENADGSVTCQGRCYHLRDSGDFESMVGIFGERHRKDLKTYCCSGGRYYFSNPKMTVYYRASEYGDAKQGNTLVGNVGYRVDAQGYICYGSKRVVDEGRRFMVADMTVQNFALSRTDGYTLSDGFVDAWDGICTERGSQRTMRTHLGIDDCAPSYFLPLTDSDVEVVLFKRWESSGYAICYVDELYGRTKEQRDITFADEISFLTAEQCGFYSPDGRTLLGWSAVPNASAVIYPCGAHARGMIPTDGMVLRLYAVWSAPKYTITICNQAPAGSGYADGATRTIYEIYRCAFTATDQSPAGTNDETIAGQVTGKLSYVSGLPSYEGYPFAGYRATVGPLAGRIVIGPDGRLPNPDTFTEDTVLYPVYGSDDYTIYYDANGGSTAVASQRVSFQGALPETTIPVRPGYVFTGYYYNGEVWYNESGARRLTVYPFRSSITVTAGWRDNEKPDAVLTADSGERQWTNAVPTVSASASDNGSGVARAELTYVSYNGMAKNTPVSVNWNKSKGNWTASFRAQDEGILVYRLEVWDHAGNTKEASLILYTDYTAPSGNIGEDGSGYLFGSDMKG